MPFAMIDTALISGICVNIKKSMSRFADDYVSFGIDLAAGKKRLP